MVYVGSTLLAEIKTDPFQYIIAVPKRGVKSVYKTNLRMGFLDVMHKNTTPIDQNNHHRLTEWDLVVGLRAITIDLLEVEGQMHPAP